MSVRYRKSEPRMWTDAAFRDLSAAPPNGQTLWLFFLTGPFTTAIPGAIVGSDAAIAKALGWSLEGFHKAFLEVESKGLAKADWKAGLVVLEKALIDSDGTARETNKPGNPNVLKSWAGVYAELPDCELKSLVLSRIESLSQSLSKAFAKAFEEAFRKALAKDGRKPLAKASVKAFAQEQDQEQEQEGQPSLSLGSSAGARDLVHDLASACCEELASATGSSYQPTAVETRKLAAKLVKAKHSAETVRLVVRDRIAAWAGDPKMGEFLRPATLLAAGNFAKYLDDLNSRAPSATARPREMVY